MGLDIYLAKVVSFEDAKNICDVNEHQSVEQIEEILGHDVERLCLYTDDNLERFEKIKQMFPEYVFQTTQSVIDFDLALPKMGFPQYGNLSDKELDQICAQDEDADGLCWTYIEESDGMSCVMGWRENGQIIATLRHEDTPMKIAPVNAIFLKLEYLQRKGATSQFYKDGMWDNGVLFNVEEAERFGEQYFYKENNPQLLEGPDTQKMAEQRLSNFKENVVKALQGSEGKSFIIFM